MYVKGVRYDSAHLSITVCMHCLIEIARKAMGRKAVGPTDLRF